MSARRCIPLVTAAGVSLLALAATACFAVTDLSGFSGGVTDASESPDPLGATSDAGATYSDADAGAGDSDPAAPRFVHLGNVWRTDDARTSIVEGRLGAPAADRRIIVTLAGKGDRIMRADSGFSVVVNGVVATRVGATEHDVAAWDAFAAVYSAEVPTGATGTLEVVFGGAATTYFSFAMSWFAAYGGFGSPQRGREVAPKEGSKPATTSVTCRRGGLVLAAGGAHESGPGEHWSFLYGAGTPFEAQFQESTKHFEGIAWHSPATDWTGMNLEAGVVGQPRNSVLWVVFD